MTDEEAIRPGELLPCPFCGGGEHRMDVIRHWTGMRYQPIAFALRHWCGPVVGLLNCHVEFRGKTREAAVAHWNRRIATVNKKEIACV